MNSITEIMEKIPQPDRSIVGEWVIEYQVRVETPFVEGVLPAIVGLASKLYWIGGIEDTSRDCLRHTAREMCRKRKHD